jgi:hypothetical protein
MTFVFEGKRRKEKGREGKRDGRSGRKGWLAPTSYQLAFDRGKHLRALLGHAVFSLSFYGHCLIIFSSSSLICGI